MKAPPRSTHYFSPFFLLVLLLASGSTYSQAIVSADSLNNNIPKSNWKKIVIAPVALISLGLLSTTDNEIFDGREIYDALNKSPNFHTHADDYLQYAPIAGVYALNLFGIKGQHDFANRTALLIKSELIEMAMVLPLKKLTAVPRPDSGAPNSFPSGHTAQAFAAATFFHKEYGKKYPWLSVVAYGSASTVGVLRIMNHRHWVSDVLVGAGIGILSTNLAYLTHQNKWGGKKRKLSGMVVAPTYGQRSVGVFLMLPIH